MIAEMRSIQCPNCGQRLGISLEKTEFICINCKTKHRISEASMPIKERIIIGTEEFMDIWRHPNKYSETKVISVFLTLAGMQEDTWPEEIKIAHKKNLRRQNIKACVYVLLAVCFLIAIILL